MKNSLNKNDKIVVDFETNGLYPYNGSRPFIVGMEDESGNVCLARPNEDKWKTFRDIISDPACEKICHNAKFEIKMTKHLGITPKGKFHDTMALAVLINEYQPLSLGGLSSKLFKDFSKDMVQNWLKANKRSFKKEHGREPNYSDVPKDLLEKYLEGDLDKTLRIFWLWYPVICKDKKLKALYDMETDLAYDIVNMEDRGVLIDVAKCHQLIKELKPKQKVLEQEIYDEVGFKFNLASPKQLGDILEQLEIDTGEKTVTGKPKTSYDLLKDLMDTHPFIKKFITWRTIQKMLSTYIIPFTQENYAGTIHPNYWQYGKDKAIVTGRFSSTDPSFHTIPSRVKGDNPELVKLGGIVKQVIIPRPGYAFIFFDFKQIEMRLFVHYIQDAHGIKDIKEGREIYRSLACRIFGQEFMDNLKETNPEEHERYRDIAKQTALSLIYGMGVSSFAKRLKLTKQEATKHKREFFRQLPSAQPWIMSVQKALYNKGYVEDVFGRQYHVPNEMSYKAVNAICQGTAATLMKKTIIKARALQKYGAYPFLTLHDEIGLEVPLENVDIVAIEGKKLLEDRTHFSVPLELDVEVAYNNWKDKIKWKPKEKSPSK